MLNVPYSQYLTSKPVAEMKFSICSFLFLTAMGGFCCHLRHFSAHFCQVVEGGEGDTHVFLTEAEFFGSSPAFGCTCFAQPTATCGRRRAIWAQPKLKEKSVSEWPDRVVGDGLIIT